MKPSKSIHIILILILCSVTTLSQSQPGTVRYPSNLDDSDSLFRTTDNARTTLTNSITNSSSAIDVTSTSAFPTTGSITIDNEIIYYTSKTSTQFSGLTRGAAGTSAASHTAGVSVRSPILSVHHNTQATAIIVTQTKVGSGSSTPTTGTVLYGNGSGTSAWSSTPQLTRLTMTGSTTTASPPTLGASSSTRWLIYDSGLSDGEYMGAGVESGAFWFNNVASGSYNFYFGASGSTKTTMSSTNAKLSGTVQLQDAGSKPTCDSTQRFRIWVDAGGAGVKDDVQICTKDASDVYAWRTIY